MVLRSGTRGPWQPWAVPACVSQAMAFATSSAHRFWLDVKGSNQPHALAPPAGLRRGRARERAHHHRRRRRLRQPDRDGMLDRGYQARVALGLGRSDARACRTSMARLSDDGRQMGARRRLVGGSCRGSMVLRHRSSCGVSWMASGVAHGATGHWTSATSWCWPTRRPGARGNREDGCRARPMRPRRCSPGWRSRPVKSVQHWLREASRLHGVDVELLRPSSPVGSGSMPAVSPRGAIGLMQITAVAGAALCRCREARRPPKSGCSTATSSPARACWPT